MSQYKEAFYLSIPHVGANTAQIVARSLSNCMETPRQIAMYFALEPIGIAAPFLIHGYQLGQLDLLQIIEKAGLSHARIIATRPDIGPSVVNRLRSLNDRLVNDHLASNQALLKPIRQSKYEALFDAVAKSKATDTGTAKPIDNDVEAAPRGINKTSARLLKAAGQALAEEPLGSPDRQVALQETAASEAPQRGKMLNIVEAIEKVARSKQRQAMSVLMQKHLNLSASAIEQLFEDRSGDAFCVLLKSLGADSGTVVRILMLTYPSIGLSVQNAMRTIRLFEKLDVQSCKDAVAKWPKSKGGFVGATNAHEGHFHDSGNRRDTSFGQRQTAPGQIIQEANSAPGHARSA